MRNVNVLVFPCGSEIGLELHRSLKDIRFVNLFGASSVSDHGEFVYKNYCGGLPYVTDSNFINAINQCISQNDIDFIFPAMDSVILALSDQQDQLKATLLTSSKEAVRVCRSKAETYKKLAGADYLPAVYQSADEVTEYPVIIKPAVGQGSNGFRILSSEEDLRYELAVREEEQVICEYLPGEEYTIDCFTDRKGKLRYSACRVRGRVKSGISVRSYLAAPDERILEIAEDINSRMEFRGVWFFQLKKDKHGDYRLLECATRVAGTMCIERGAGINLPLLTIFDAMDMDVDLTPQTDTVEVDRALCNVFRSDIEYDEVYMDFDDTLIVKDHVNYKALQFCYQCVDRGIRLILLTRHETDIYKDLKRYRIASELFDTIICIPRSERKIDHVAPSKKALMIDDSFAERKAMQDAFGIHALGVDAIETLLDERM